MKSHMGFRDECVKFKRQPAAQAPHLLQIGKPEIHVRFNVLPHRRSCAFYTVVS